VNGDEACSITDSPALCALFCQWDHHGGKKERSSSSSSSSLTAILSLVQHTLTHDGMIQSPVASGTLTLPLPHELQAPPMEYMVPLIDADANEHAKVLLTVTHGSH